MRGHRRSWIASPGPDSLPAIGSPTGSAPVRGLQESEPFPSRMPESLLDFCTLPALLVPEVEGGALEGRLLRALLPEVCASASRDALYFDVITVKSWRAGGSAATCGRGRLHRRLTAARTGCDFGPLADCASCLRRGRGCCEVLRRLACGCCSHGANDDAQYCDRHCQEAAGYWGGVHSDSFGSRAISWRPLALRPRLATGVPLSCSFSTLFRRYMRASAYGGLF